MSDTPIDGGPAFPSDFIELSNSGFSKGMTLRDYFAAAALQGMIAQSRLILTNKALQDPDVASGGAYLYADAMLEARKREYK